MKNIRYDKRDPIRSYSGPYFPTFGFSHFPALRISPYSVRGKEGPE